MREIGQYMNGEHPGAPVFLADGAELSAFNAEVYSNGWHQYGAYTRIQSAHDELDIAGILRQWNVHYIVAPTADSKFEVRPRALRDFIKDCITPEYRANWYLLARVANTCHPGREIEPEPLLVSPGWYDDSDPAILYKGSWIHDKGWAQAYAHTVTFSNVAGSEIRFAFEGAVLSYVYTRSANRGMADISIDGAHIAVLDLYSPEPKWRSRSTFKLSTGRHLAVITILPGKNPKSADRWIDVDAFEVQ